jgi:hypothetical protein
MHYDTNESKQITVEVIGLECFLEGIPGDKLEYDSKSNTAKLFNEGIPLDSLAYSPTLYVYSPAKFPVPTNVLPTLHYAELEMCGQNMGKHQQWQNQRSFLA